MRKGRKVAKHCVYLTCGSRGSKSRLAKAAGAEPSIQMRDEKLHAVVLRSTFANEKANNITFRPLLEVEMSKKVHAVMARSTFANEKAKSTTFGPLFEVEMSKKCTLLWREAHV